VLDLGTLARLYGYPVVAIGTALQGEAILLICGFLAHQGYLSVWWVWIVAAVSAMIGDVSYYHLGRHYGDRLIMKLPRTLRSGLETARNLVNRHPTKVLLFMRYFFGMRMIMPILCGMSTIPRGRFLIFNLFTSFFWAGLFVWTGWLFGVAAQEFVHEVERVELWLTIGLAAAGIVYHYVGKYLRERLNRQRSTHDTPQGLR
jgi:membrane protein DedA with SNARE-associated domain